MKVTHAGNTVRKIVFAGITGLLLSFCYVAGSSLDKYDTLDLTDGHFYGKLLLTALFVSAILYGVWEIADRRGQRPKWIRMSRFCSQINDVNIPYLLCVGLLLLSWIPAFLSIYPGAFAYDAYAEWQQVQSGALTAHHPVIHVLFLGGLVEGLHSLTGSYNLGIAVYTVLQMILFANALALSIRFLQKFRISGGWQIFALAFYCLSPVVQLFSVSATKDVLFTAAQLLFFQFVILFYCDRRTFFASKKTLAGFAAVTFFTMTLRNNGLYIALIVCFLMLCSCVRARKEIRNFVAVWAIVLAVYGVYTGPVYQALDVAPGGVEEMLSVPIQQMARVYRYDYDSLEEQELELLYRFLPKENLEAYRPTVSDFVKKGFQKDYFAEHKSEFVRLWIKWGLEHPLTYVNSFLVNTVDFWYPHAVIDGYRDAYGKSSYFDYTVDEPGTEVVLLQGAHRYYEAISHHREVQQNGWSFLFLSPGWYFVVFLVLFFYLWRCRDYKMFVPMLVFVLTMLTVLLGPIALVRYVLIFFLGFPALLTVVFCREKYEGSCPAVQSEEQASADQEDTEDFHGKI